MSGSSNRTFLGKVLSAVMGGVTGALAAVVAAQMKKRVWRLPARRRYTSAMATSPPWPREIRVDLPAWIDEVVDHSRTWPTDDEKMALAIDLARENVVRGTGGPFGAAIFESGTGRLVGVGVNAVLRHQNSCLHAEMVAFMVAAAAVGSYSLDLPGRAAHELITSCDPCAMCLGGVLWSGVRRVVSGASRDDALALGFDEGPVFPESYAYLEARGVTFTRHVRQEEARSVLARYMAHGGPVYNG